VGILPAELFIKLQFRPPLAKLELAVFTKLKSKKTLIGIILLGILAFVLPITLLLLRDSTNLLSRAALPDQLESESGVLSSIGVSKQSDSQASGGQYIRFAKSASGPTPTSPPSSSTKGPRYDLYGAGANGNFPPFPTGSNVFIVPTSVTSSSNVSRALGDWINDTIPDGASATSPSIVVFDNSGGGTKYGPGREYILNEFLVIKGAPPGSPVGIIDGSAWPYYRKNITFWGYNTKLRFNFTSGDNNSRGVTNGVHDNLIAFIPGGFENMKWLGFDIQGTNMKTNTWDVRYEWAEPQKGFMIVSFNNLEIKDNYFHNVGGDWIYLNSGLGPPRDPAGSIADINRSWGIHHDWPHGPYNKNAEIAYNNFDGAGNMGLAIEGAIDGVNIHHNNILNSAISPINVEEPPYAPEGYRFLKNFTIADNYIANWDWWLPGPGGYPSGHYGWSGWAFQLSRSYEDKGAELHENWTIVRNVIEGGFMGRCNPITEEQRWGGGKDPNAPRCNGGPGGGFLMISGSWWGEPKQALENRNIVIKDNVSNIPTGQIVNNAIYLTDWDGVTVTGNNFQGAPVKCEACTGVNISNNK
jgi:hypothetical protein